MKIIKLPVLVAAVSAAGIAFAGCGAADSADNTGNDTKNEDTSGTSGASNGSDAAGESNTETSDTNASLVATVTMETNTTITTAQTDPRDAQDAEYMRYLKDLYNGADAYAGGYPQKIVGIDNNYSGATTYLKYAIADLDGDDKLELITVESNNYAVDKDKTGENIDKGYLTFRLFKTNDGGGIVQNNKINGLSNGISFGDYEKNMTCFDNGIIMINQTPAVNTAWGYNYDEVLAFLYFDNGIVKKLNVPVINEYLDSEWSKDNSSYVLMDINEGKYEICLGGAQDSYTEMTEMNKDQYEKLKGILTDGKEVKAEFKNINKDNLKL